METLMLIMQVAKAMGIALVLSAEEPKADEQCHRFDDYAAILVCMDKDEKATIRIFPIWENMQHKEQ